VGSTLVAGVALLVAFNAMNPEAFVARRDLRRGPHADMAYLSTLSDDAVPAVIAHLDSIDPLSAGRYLDAVCSRPDEHHGWASYNRARSGAERAVSAWCRSRGAAPPRRSD
jgi:hypothetical protein